MYVAIEILLPASKEMGLQAPVQPCRSGMGDLRLGFGHQASCETRQAQQVDEGLPRETSHATGVFRKWTNSALP